MVDPLRNQMTAPGLISNPKASQLALRRHPWSRLVATGHIPTRICNGFNTRDFPDNI